MLEFFNEQGKLFKYVQGEFDGAEFVDIKEILTNLCEKKYTDFLHEAISRGKNLELSKGDFFQFSSIDNATCNLSKYLVRSGNEGYNWTQIAAFLPREKDQKDNYEALRKYGENHIKTAEALGFCYRNKENICWLTKVGYVYSTLDPLKQKKLLSRLALRLKFIQKVLSEAAFQDIDFYDLMAILKESTKIRRSSNAKTLLGLVRDNGEIELSYLFKCIKYKGEYL